MGDSEAVCTLSGEGADDDLADFIVNDSEDAEMEGEGGASVQMDELQTVLGVCPDRISSPMTRAQLQPQAKIWGKNV